MPNKSPFKLGLVTLLYHTSTTTCSPALPIFPVPTPPYRKVLPSLPSIASRDNHIRFHLLERFFRSE